MIAPLMVYSSTSRSWIGKHLRLYSGEIGGHGGKKQSEGGSRCRSFAVSSTSTYSTSKMSGNLRHGNQSFLVLCGSPWPIESATNHGDMGDHVTGVALVHAYWLTPGLLGMARSSLPPALQPRRQPQRQTLTPKSPKHVNTHLEVSSHTTLIAAFQNRLTAYPDCTPAALLHNIITMAVSTFELPRGVKVC